MNDVEQEFTPEEKLTVSSYTVIIVSYLYIQIINEFEVKHVIKDYRKAKVGSMAIPRHKLNSVLII